MGEIKWIKITTDIFDDEKIKLIDGMPERDTILVIWMKLLTLAGKSNKSGYLLFSDNIPYDEEMLSTLFNRPINSVRLAIATFKRFGMITVELSENSEKEILYISNWGKHQNIEGMEKLKIKWKEASKRYRENKKLEYHDSSYDESYDIIQQNKNKNKNKEKEIYKEKESFDEKQNTSPHPPKGECPSNEGRQEELSSKININLDKTPYNEIVAIYHNLLPSAPKVQILSAKRRSQMKARWKANPDLAFWNDFFTKVSQSSFLTGRVESKDGRVFLPDLEWLMKEANFIKVVEGRYDDKIKEKPRPVSTGSGYVKFNPSEWGVPE